MKKLAPIEKLHVAAQVAPDIRATGKRLRPIKVVDDDGHVVGVVTHREVLDGAAKRAEIEISTVGQRAPGFIPCKRCGMLIERKPRSTRRYCRLCKRAVENERTKRKRARNKQPGHITVACVGCDAMMHVAENSRRKWCDSCQRAKHATRARQRSANPAIREAHREACQRWYNKNRRRAAKSA